MVTTVSMRKNLIKNNNDNQYENTFTNETSGQFLELPLIKHPINERERFLPLLSNRLKNIKNIFGARLLDYLTFSIAPIWLIFKIVRDVSKSVDIILSNVPGPKKSIYLGGHKVTQIIPVPALQYFNFLSLVFSYNGEFSTLVFSNNNRKVSSKIYVNVLEDEIDKLINN